MFSAQSAAKLIKLLESDDFRVLSALSSVISRQKFLSHGQLVRYSMMHKDMVEYRIKRLTKFNLISDSSNGICLLMSGLDAVVLKIFVDNNMVEGLGRPIGVGKESDVFEAITENAQLRALKFFRIGRTSFRQVRRKRSFTKDEHFHGWLLTNIRAAEKEYNILHQLQNKGITIPTPYFRGFHAIVMSRINGVRLVQVKKLGNPRQTLFDILKDVMHAYGNNIINCDLSEYNILVDTDDRPWIIDWPQSVTRDHPNANLLIRRDITNVVNFFNRRFHLGIENSEALDKVLHGTT